MVNLSLKKLSFICFKIEVDNFKVLNDIYMHNFEIKVINNFKYPAFLISFGKTFNMSLLDVESFLFSMFKLHVSFVFYDGFLLNLEFCDVLTIFVNNNLDLLKKESIFLLTKNTFIFLYHFNMLLYLYKCLSMEKNKRLII